jgi:hypothetical protein
MAALASLMSENMGFGLVHLCFYCLSKSCAGADGWFICCATVEEFIIIESTLRLGLGLFLILRPYAFRFVALARIKFPAHPPISNTRVYTDMHFRSSFAHIRSLWMYRRCTLSWCLEIRLPFMSGQNEPLYWHVCFKRRRGHFSLVPIEQCLFPWQRLRVIFRLCIISLSLLVT